MTHPISIKKTKIASNGTLCISDPCYINNFSDIFKTILGKKISFSIDSVLIDTPKGLFDTNIYYTDVADWGERVSMVEIIFDSKNNNISKPQLLANLGVDSGQMSFFDLQAATENWSFDETVIAVDFWGRDQEIIATILSEKYTLLKARGRIYRFEIVNVENDLIKEFLDDFYTLIGKSKNSDFILNHPLYNPNLFVVSSPKTKTTYDALCDLEDETHLLGDSPMLVTHTGLGDGVYPVFGLFDNEKLISLQIKFLS